MKTLSVTLPFAFGARMAEPGGEAVEREGERHEVNVVDVTVRVGKGETYDTQGDVVSSKVEFWIVRDVVFRGEE